MFYAEGIDRPIASHRCVRHPFVSQRKRTAYRVRALHRMLHVTIGTSRVSSERYTLSLQSSIYPECLLVGSGHANKFWKLSSALARGCRPSWDFRTIILLNPRACPTGRDDKGRTKLHRQLKKNIGLHTYWVGESVFISTIKRNLKRRDFSSP